MKINRNVNNLFEQYKQNDMTEVYSLNKEKFNELIQNKFYKKYGQNIEKFPITNKKIALENYNEILNDSYVSKKWATSGTSGGGFVYPVSKEFLDNQWAAYWRFRYVLGISQNEWFVYFIGKPILPIKQNKGPFWLKVYTSKQLLMSQYHLSSSTVNDYLNAIRKSKIKCIHGYPSTLAYFSSLISENNLTHISKGIGIKTITVSSEKLHESQRKVIEDTFNCKVRQIYGQTEGIADIYECSHGKLHIDESFSYVELIPTINNTYKIIGTCYHNKAFPLIRYDIGDEVEYYDSDTCKCDRKSRVIRQIFGRDEDYIVLKDGRQIGRLDHIFKNLDNVVESQIIQNEKGTAIFNIVKNKQYSDNDEKLLIDEIVSKLGDDFKFEFNYLDMLPRTKNGKVKFVINNYIKENKQ